jgi:hypothetical protein
MSEPPQPTIYSVVMDRRTGDLWKFVSNELELVYIPFRDALKEKYLDTVEKAYIRGVEDGFAQGVAAASPLKEEK